MDDKQIWQTIALDLKRAANYKLQRSDNKAIYYLNEARDLFKKQKLDFKLLKIKSLINFEGNPEDLLLASSLISLRI